MIHIDGKSVELEGALIEDLLPEFATIAAAVYRLARDSRGEEFAVKAVYICVKTGIEDCDSMEQVIEGESNGN